MGCFKRVISKGFIDNEYWSRDLKEQRTSCTEAGAQLMIERKSRGTSMAKVE